MTILRVGLVQLNSRHDRAANLDAIDSLVAEAAGRGARFVLLPEHAPYLGPADGYQAGAEAIPGPTSARFAALARRHGVYLHAGSLVERTDVPGKYANTSLVFDLSGRSSPNTARSTSTTWRYRAGSARASRTAWHRATQS